MQALINRDEVVIELAKKILARSLKTRYQPFWNSTDEYVLKTLKQKLKTGLFTVDFNMVNQCIRADLQHSRDLFVAEYKAQFRPMVNWLADNYDSLDIADQDLIDMCVSGKQQSFVKNLALQIDPATIFVSAAQQVDTSQPVILRNTIKNEKLISALIKNKTDFWFVDSGYTNFLTGKKQWHRLVHNHIHHGVSHGSFPADRLHLLGTFPKRWRKSGSKILVVENSERHYAMFGDSLEAWRDRVGQGLRKHTDRYIEFRAKHGDRKTRDSLWELLQHSTEYCCVVTDASAAAIEAIWAGIPVISLNQHITNSVSRNQLDLINNLYCEDIGDWLCRLSYSQFTEQEMYNGTALALTQEYYGV